MPITIEELRALPDADLSTLRQRVAAEQERRDTLTRAAGMVAQLVANFEAGVADNPPVPIADVPVTDTVGPGQRVVDTAGVEWRNISGAWLSPHSVPPQAGSLWWTQVSDLPDPGEVAAWAAGTVYAAGDLVSYQGSIYSAVQGHTAQAGWEPPAVPALWTPQG